jgi:Flp pilus assembly protein TadD, contains TPR repeats
MKLSLLLPTALLCLFTSCGGSPESALKRGNAFYEEGKLEDAALQYRKAIQGNPNLAEAHYRLGLVELKRKNPGEALRLFSRAAELQPQNEKALESLADLVLASYMANRERPAGLYERLQQIASQLRKVNPQSTMLARLEGYLALTDRRIPEALRIFQAAHQAHPSDPDITAGLVRTLVESGDLAGAERLGLELINTHKSYGPIYDLLSVLYLQQNRLSDSGALLVRKVENNPDNGDYVLQLATFYATQQDWPKVAETLERILRKPKEFPKGHLMAGNFYTDLGRFESALQHFEAGMKQAPADRLSYMKRIAWVYTRQNQREKAEQMLAEVLKQAPDDEEALLLRANLSLASGDRERLKAAAADYDRLLKKRPDDIEIRTNLARALGATGELDRARKELVEVSRRDTSNLAVRLMLAELALQQRQYNEALQYATEALRLSPNHPRARLFLSVALLRLGKTQEAKAEVDTILKRFPNSKEASLQLGLIYLAENKYREADQLFRKIASVDQSDYRVYEALAASQLASGEVEHALKTLEEQSRRFPAIKAALASTALAAGKYDYAIDQYRSLLEKSPNSYDLHLRLGAAYEAAKKWDMAAHTYEQASRLMPNRWEAIARLGYSYDALGRRDEAIEAYRRALKIQPDNPLILNNLAWALMESGKDLQEALRAAESARRKRPDDVSIADTLGMVYLKQGMSDSALQIFTNLVNKHPNSATYRYRKGMALIARGDKESGRGELMKALASNPSQDEEAKIRQLLKEL